jgi:hypothetical protein
MHAYATDSDGRKNVTALLALVGLAVAGLVGFVAEHLTGFVPWELSSPSAFFIFGVLYWAFAKYCWKWRLWRRLDIVEVPDLNGRWKGHLKTSFDSHENRHAIEVEVKQHWTKMSVHLEAKKSFSYSVTASLLVNDPRGILLCYQYINEPKSATASSEMSMHRGTTYLRLSEHALEGHYYAGRSRENHGYIKIEKELG